MATLLPLLLPQLLVSAMAPPPRPLELRMVNQTVSPDARCLDGSAPALYWRPGVGNSTRSAVLFFEGGGWCLPTLDYGNDNLNCAVRRNSDLGSSVNYPSSIQDTGCATCWLHSRTQACGPDALPLAAPL